MPTDLSPHAELGIIHVRDRAGVGLPFSKGLMATSILATGLETLAAYRLAAEIEQLLRGRESNEILADELAELAEATILNAAGPVVAKRYRAWRRVKRSGRPVILALSGAPGVGKSTIATRLAVRLGITRVVTTDTIREVLRSIVPESVLPELHVSTYDAIESLPNGLAVNSPLQTYYRQANAVGAATVAVARRLCAERRSAILEGVHLIPGLVRRGIEEMPGNPIVVEMALVLADEELHRAHLSCRLHGEPLRRGSRHLAHFSAIRDVQGELIRSANSIGVSVLDLSSPESLTQELVDQVAEKICIDDTKSKAYCA